MSVEKGEDPKTIIIAQRDKVDQEFIRIFLERIGGFRVVDADSATDVIHKLQAGPDLILVDTRMDGDFTRAVELMRRMPHLNHVGIAMLSGDQSAIKQGMAKGFNGYIQKPFTPEGLLSRIWKILDSTPPVPADGGPAKLEVDVDKIEDLPTLPAVYAQVESLFEDADVDAGDLAKVIETDPSITLKLLKLSNSAFFGFNREIKSLSDAISLLGNQTVKNAVLSISVLEAMKGVGGSSELDKKEFWRHSAACGSIVRFIANKMRILRPECFTSGILHDIGKLILDGLYTDFYQDVFRRVREDGVSVLEAEEQGLGFTHAKLGRELAEHWGIPKRLVEAIAHHHAPDRAELDPELASLVHIGDAVSRNLGFGSGGDSLIPAIQSFSFTQLAMEPEDLIDWEADMMRDAEKDMAFLSAIA